MHGIAAILFWRRGLVPRMPILWTYFVACVVRSTILTQMSSAHYHQVFTFSAPVLLLVESFAAVELFHLATGYYPRFDRFGQVALGIFALCGTGLAALTRWAFVAPTWALHPALLMERYSMLALTVVLAGAILTVRWLGHKIPRATSRAITILCFDTFAGFAVATTQVMGFRSFAVRVGLPIVMGFVCSGLWCFVPQWQEVETGAAPSMAEVMASRAESAAVVDGLRNSVVAVQRVTS